MGNSDPPNESFASLFEGSQASNTRPRRFRRGDRLEVKVVALGRDAVFVDLGGKQEGFIDGAELLGSDGKISVSVGTSLSCVVARDDGERVQLTPVFVRAPVSDSSIDVGNGETVSIPRARSGPLLVEGAHVRGTVSGVERYGVFVQITGTQGRSGRGLVHVAETGTPRNADLHKLFTVGMEVEAKILAIQEDGKIRLSFKALSADAEREDFDAYNKARDAGAPEDDAIKAAGGDKGSKPKADKPRPPPVPKTLGTLGDLLAKRRG
jgi:small subunit ribosomal protein S1